jgi:hypothetical protein
VTDVLDPLSDGGSSCGESCDLGAMVEVMALGDEEGSDSSRPARPLLERPPPQEQDAPLLERDASDISVVDLRAPLSRVIDPAQVPGADVPRSPPQGGRGGRSSTPGEHHAQRVL